MQILFEIENPTLVFKYEPKPSRQGKCENLANQTVSQGGGTHSHPPPPPKEKVPVRVCGLRNQKRSESETHVQHISVLQILEVGEKVGLKWTGRLFRTRTDPLHHQVVSVAVLLSRVHVASRSERAGDGERCGGLVERGRGPGAARPVPRRAQPVGEYRGRSSGHGGSIKRSKLQAQVCVCPVRIFQRHVMLSELTAEETRSHTISVGIN